MAQKIDNLEILQEYLKGVLERAGHHAKNVDEIALAIVGAILWKSTDKIYVFSKEGKMKNVLWLTVNKNNFCFAFNHVTGNIDLKKDNTRGKILKSFNNQTPISEIKSYFEKL